LQANSSLWRMVCSVVPWLQTQWQWSVNLSLGLLHHTVVTCRLSRWCCTHDEWIAERASGNNALRILVPRRALYISQFPSLMTDSWDLIEFYVQIPMYYSYGVDRIILSLCSLNLMLGHPYICPILLSKSDVFARFSISMIMKRFGCSTTNVFLHMLGRPDCPYH
jgi:hypothetical protein